MQDKDLSGESTNGQCRNSVLQRAMVCAIENSPQCGEQVTTGAFEGGCPDG